MSKSTKPSKSIQPPKGTRDLYPDDVLKRRYIQNAWRDASLRCGFDEIEGPTFETSDLYSIKSGEGILSELFQTFSGKGGQETLDKLVAKGKADFALRPEFTPTLARMYAARAKQLPKPCKWFTAGPYFRAERPQRGRLREFLQWNCDILGDATSQADSEIFGVCISLFEALGISNNECMIQYNNRQRLEQLLLGAGISVDEHTAWFDVIDKAPKIGFEGVVNAFWKLDPQKLRFPSIVGFLISAEVITSPSSTTVSIPPTETQLDFVFEHGMKAAKEWQAKHGIYADAAEQYLDKALEISNLSMWCKRNHAIVRGLAYYTGTVFEAIAEGERAVAGGGRYDNLIELMGGPPTPAVGFAMGDVVLTNLLEDNNLIPQGQELMEAVARPQASIRPQAFIAVPNNDEENRAAAQSLTATLRRGQESQTYLNNESRKPWDANRYTIPPLHTRISYKSTTNPGKLRKDADSQHAKYFIEIHAPNKVELTDMDKRESITSPTHGSFSVNPTDDNYIGYALSHLLK